MAHMQHDPKELRDAILRVPYPLGEWSLGDLIYSFFEREFFTQEQERHLYLGCPFQIEETITSGSWSEGLHLYALPSLEIPDADIMYVLKDISFTKQDQSDGNLFVREDTPFVDAYLTEETDINMWHECLEEQSYPARKRRLSSMKLKEKLHQFQRAQIFYCYEEGLEDVADGAALNSCALKAIVCKMRDYLQSETEPKDCPLPDIILHSVVSSLFRSPHFTNGLKKLLPMFKNGCDVVLSISCEGWPLCANEWITRDRIWPSHDLIKNVTKAGFHIVPKRSSNGNFRLSFSRAETTLITNLSSLQHKVLQSFKAMVKYHQGNWSKNIKEIISTYHLKTVAFWYFESSALESWTEETVEMHLVALLENLAKALDKRHLPMYFMPKVNLFSEVSKYEEEKRIVEKILQLSASFSAMKIAVDKLNAFSASLDILNVLQTLPQNGLKHIVRAFIKIILWELERSCAKANQETSISLD